MRLASKLAHDVGKYVAMTAHNLASSAPAPERHVALLARDLYALESSGGVSERASAVLERLAAPLDSVVEDARVAEALALLREADALEPDLRAGHATAAARAIAIALRVEALLLEAARDAREACRVRAV